MRSRLSLRLLLLALIPLCSSCGEDKEMIERNVELDAQIDRLEGELTEKKKLLRAEVRDVSEEIRQAAEKLKKMRSAASRMDADLIHLRDQKESLEMRFTNYRKAHPVN